MFDAGTIKIGIQVDDSGAKQSIDKVKQEIAQSSTGIDKYGAGISKIGKLASKVAVATTASIVAIGKSAVTAYASYEQLTGGVQKLFGDSANIVMKNANKAYKTAGISANKYMEQATSFSASLVNSLGGNTEKAAKYADTAVRDMSDNVNVFGSRMEDVQRAYQGFARGQFGMLDNLKLGYGGTKTEMERLLKDAEKISGKKFDLSNFSDIVEAIHIVQEEMNITGTTAKEAADTIEGSVNSMKGAWENWLTALGSGSSKKITETTDALVDSIKNVGKNVIPTIGNVLKSLKPLVALVGTAFGVKLTSKILLATNALIKYKKATNGAKAITGVMNGTLSASEALFGTLGNKVAITASKIQFLGLTGASAVGAIGALVGALSLLAYGVYKAYQEWNKYGIEVDKMCKKHDDAIDKIEANGKSAEYLINKIEELEGVEQKSNSQKELEAQYVQQLNDLYPDLNLQYDKEKDKLNQTTQAIRDKIKAMQEEARTKAYSKNMEDAYEEQAKLEVKRDNAWKEYRNAKKAYDDAVADGTIKYHKELSREYANRKAELADLSDSYRESSIEATKWANQLYSGDYDSLVKQAHDAGVKIPQSISDGIDEGKYTIPTTVEELESLIKWDKLASKATGAGIDVVANLEQGMRDGYIDIEEAINADKGFNTLVNDCGEWGKKTAEKWSEEFNSGQMDATTFVERVERALNWDTLQSNAKGGAKKVAEAFNDGLASGNINFKEAIKGLNAYDAIQAEGGKAGQKYIQGLQQKLSSGKITAEEFISQITDYANEHNIDITIDADGSKAKEEVDEVNGKEVEDKDAKITADGSQAKEETAEVNDELGEIGGETTVAEIQADSESAKANLEAVKELEESLPKEFKHTITLESNGVTETTEKLSDFADQVQRVSGKKISLKITTNVKNAQKQINSLTKKGKKVTVKVVANTATALKQLAVVQGKKLKNKTVKVSVSGYNSVMSKLNAINNKKLKDKSFTVTQHNKTVKDGSKRIGLREVPYDGYVSELHRGEAILTAAEANQYKKYINGDLTAQSSSTGVEALVDKLSQLSMNSGEQTINNIGDVTLEVSKLQDVATLEDIVKIFKQAKAFA